MRRWFIAGTGTGVGKTFVSRALARGLSDRGHKVAAIKPVESGVGEWAMDARALATACNQPNLETAPGLWRAGPPLAPFAIELKGGPKAPPPSELLEAIRGLAEGADVAIVEGCGGLLVPLGQGTTMADVATSWDAPLVVVAPDRLGVLSDLATTLEAAAARKLTVDVVVLNNVGAGTETADESPATNQEVIEACHPGLTVVRFPRVPDNDAALAEAAESSGLLRALS